MIVGLAPIDLAVIVLYLVGITFIGLRASRGVKSSGNFFGGGVSRWLIKCGLSKVV